MRKMHVWVLLLLTVVEGFIVPGNEFGFTNGTLIGNVNDPRVTKTSGCAASRRHPGILYIHNDNNHGGAVIFAINATNAKVVGSIHVTHAVNYDWEDIAVGPCPFTHESCIYIGDIGTDKGHPGVKNIYLLTEPAVINGDQNLPADKELRLSFSDLGSDTLLVDNNADMYIVGYQRGGNSAYYHIPKSTWNSASRVGITSSVHIGLHTEHKDPVAGDISPDGKQLLIKTHEHVFMWPFTSGDGADVFDKQPIQVPYIYVWQDEAICWKFDGSGYYTIPEGDKDLGVSVPLHFYQRVSV